TYRAEVARRALDAGAQIINDVSAFRFEPEVATVAALKRAGVVLMHSRGTREALHLQPPMIDPVAEVRSELERAIQIAVKSGIAQEAIVMDPGIGFGKRAEESLTVLRHLEALSPLECALLVGTSRKSFIRRIAGISPDAPNAIHDVRWATAATVAV